MSCLGGDGGRTPPLTFGAVKGGAKYQRSGLVVKGRSVAGRQHGPVEVLGRPRASGLCNLGKS